MTFRAHLLLVVCMIAGPCGSLHAATPTALLYVKDALDLSAYDKIMVDEIQFSYAEDSAGKGVSASEMARIRQSASESLRNAVAGRFEIVESPGAGVLHVRAAITGIRATHKNKNLLSYTPVGLLKQGIEAAVGSNIVLREATAEVDVLDAVTGERLISVVDPYAGYKNERATTKASWSEVTATLDTWAQWLALRLEESRPRSSAQPKWLRPPDRPLYMATHASFC